jgi:hypothetical protein
MAEKNTMSPWVRGFVALIAILLLPTLVIQLVRPDALDPDARRPTLAASKFRILIASGRIFDRLHRADTAISRFRSAEQLAEQMPDSYGPLQAARILLAESYARTGQPSAAEQTYAQIVKSSMEAGDRLTSEKQFDAAIPKYEDAERFAPHLVSMRLPSLRNAERGLAGCFYALHRDRELEAVDRRTIATLSQAGAPQDLSRAEAYQSLARARSALDNWAGAEEALLQADAFYNRIVERWSGRNDSLPGLRAQQNQDRIRHELAVCYYNENKDDLARARAEERFEVRSRNGGPRNVPMDIYTIGIRCAAHLKNQEQVRIWQQRWNDLSPHHPPFPDRLGDLSTPRQIPLH